MSLNPNQFSQVPQVGDVDLSVSNGGVFSCQVDSTQATALVAGQAVKLVNSTGGVPKVIATAANTDAPFGIVLRNQKNVNFPALQALEIGALGTVVYLTAGAAIARGAAVEIDYSTFKVITSAGINPSIGYAFDKATADGNLIRVYLRTPPSTIYLNQLANVAISNPTNGQALKYNAGTSKWDNEADLTH